MSRAALVAATAVVVALVPGVTAGVALQKADREVYLMGTRARLETYAATRQQGIAVLDRALAILEQAEDELSTWREQSAISALNRKPVGRPWQATHELCAAFVTLFRLTQATGGTFDPAIGALTDAWGIHDGGRVPSPRVLRDARRASGMRLLDFDQQACALTRRGDVRIDVGAWGKGEAIDRVRRAMPQVPWLIDFGGQIAVSGLPPGQQAWPASVAHPHIRQEGLFGVWLRQGSMSTSAGAERDLLVQGRRVAHHLDPRTGEPASFNGSVSVWHASAVVADALLTALYVMGPEEGLAWAERHTVAACYLVPAGVQVVTRMTAEFRALLSPPAD